MRELLKGIVADSKCWLELRAHERRSLSVLVRKGVVESAAFRTVSGVGARVLVDGTWGFSSAGSFERDDVRRAARDAIDAATRSASGRSRKVGRLQDCALAVGDFRSGNAAGLAAHSTEEKAALAVDTEARIRASSPAVRSATARYSEIVDRKWIVSTDGADAHIEDSKAEFAAGAVAGEGDEMTTAFHGTGRDRRHRGPLRGLEPRRRRGPREQDRGGPPFRAVRAGGRGHGGAEPRARGTPRARGRRPHGRGGLRAVGLRGRAAGSDRRSRASS